jgi:hypothetical protein
MVSATVAQWLVARGAHHDVVSWAEAYGDDWTRALTECPRGDWLLGIAARIGFPARELVLAAAQCVDVGLEVVPDALAAEGASAARAWAEGTLDAAPCKELAARLDASATAAPDPATAAVRMAAYAALIAIEAPDHAAGAAAGAVEASTLASGDCGMMASMRYAHHACAERVRAVMPVERWLAAARASEPVCRGSRSRAAATGDIAVS